LVSILNLNPMRLDYWHFACPPLLIQTQGVLGAMLGVLAHRLRGLLLAKSSVGSNLTPHMIPSFVLAIWPNSMLVFIFVNVTVVPLFDRVQPFSIAFIKLKRQTSKQGAHQWSSNSMPIASPFFCKSIKGRVPFFRSRIDSCFQL